MRPEIRHTFLQLMMKNTLRITFVIKGQGISKSYSAINVLCNAINKNPSHSSALDKMNPLTLSLWLLQEQVLESEKQKLRPRWQFSRWDQALSLQRSPSRPKLLTSVMLMLFIFSHPLFFFFYLSLFFSTTCQWQGGVKHHSKTNTECKYINGHIFIEGVFNADPKSGSALMLHLCQRQGQGTVALSSHFYLQFFFPCKLFC